MQTFRRASARRRRLRGRDMDPMIQSALKRFDEIYLAGIPILLRTNETAFLSFLCVVSATDALAAYRYTSTDVGQRFRNFVTDYFPPEYASHAVNLYLFRCRMRHSFSPAHFSVLHASPGSHLKPSGIGDIYLSDKTFFAHMEIAAKRYFAELSGNAALQSDMLARLQNLSRGGAIY
jgi:hypothetical protein